MNDVLAALQAAATVDRPVAVLAAHPDDETLGIGSRFSTMRHLRLIQLTDGAPRDLVDARRNGFADWQSYAAARAAELDCALDCLGAAQADRRRYDLPDQQALPGLPEIVARLADDLSGMAAVITHPYEHGHPDHDTAALAVALACETLVARGEAPPERLEFASYHLDGNGPVLGRFRPDSGPPDAALVLTPAQLAMKQQALACFRIQAAFIAQFPLTPERLRPAPTYDFTAAPGPALYDQFGWRVSAAAWRAEAKEILEQCL